MTSEDDGFREIQLNGKQLVFLFMAVTVVSVVIFLSGVLVGRGVRAERVEAVQTAAADATVATPPHVATAASDDDPRKAAPPSPATEETGKDSPARDAIDEPPVAVNRTPPPPATVVGKAPESSGPRPADKGSKPAPAPAPEKPAAKQAQTPQPAVSSAAPAATAPPATADTARTDAATDAATRAGYAVQVAAVNARGEADSIVKRLSAKGYSAYVEDPRGKVTMFRVRVGTFKTRREAQTTADRLRKEEKFKPWVTR